MFSLFIVDVDLYKRSKTIIACLLFLELKLNINEGTASDRDSFTYIC